MAALLALIAGRPCFALDPKVKPSDYIVTHWDTESGLPHNSVRHLYQTRDGYLWIGTSFGLARFDGLTFTVFNTTNTAGIPNNEITSMAETKDGSLWVGTGAGLVRYFNRQFTTYTRNDGLASNIVAALCAPSDGSLWIGGRSGIVRWLDGKFIQDINTSEYDLLGLRDITVDHENSLWLATGSEALRYKDGVFTKFGVQQGLSGAQVLIIREDANSHIIAVTSKGLLRLENDHFVPFEQNSALASLSTNNILADRGGNLWVGSVAGLDRFYGGKVNPYIDRYSHKFGVVDALLEDREGCLWVGASDGLYRLTDRRAESLSQAEGVTGTLVNCVTQTRDGNVWISSWGGGVERFEDGKVKQHYGLGSPLSHLTVTAIYEAPDGVMWFGNRGSSIDRVEGDKTTTYVLTSGLTTSRPVTALLADDDGTLLVGISNRGLLQLRDGQLVPVPEADAVAKTTVYSFYRRADGRLLMGTRFGVFERLADRSWQQIKFTGLHDPVIAKYFLSEADGTCWLATEGNGLVRWKDGTAKAYGSRKGMIDDSLFAVLSDDLGSLWVSSARGIARVRKNELAQIDNGSIAKLNCMTFGRADGLLSASSPSNGSPLACQLRDGRLIFSTDRGAAVIDPRAVQANSQPPAVVVESVVADDQPLSIEGGATLPAGTNKVEIHYTALSLVVPERLRFRYTLEGSDTRWVEAEHDRIAHYTHLGPGDYTFHVLACNNDGVWNELGTTLSLKVLPLYYQTVWFRLAISGLIVSIIGLLFWLRVRQLNERQRELKRTNELLDQRVRERTGELSRSNEELRQRELLFRLIFEHAPVGISWKRSNLGNDYHFNSTLCRILDLRSDTSPDYSILSLVHPEDAPRLTELNQSVSRGKADSYTTEARFKLTDGGLVWGLLSVAVIRDASGFITQDISILEDITARKKAEEEVVTTYQNLVEASRMAGMAEVATDVLHNVGNVLNSLNVSSTLISADLRASKVDSLSRVTAMIKEHATDLSQFLATDPKGKLLPDFMESLTRRLIEERAHLLKETTSMQKNIDHIKEIVSMQQSYASAGAIVESFEFSALVEDALRINSAALVGDDIVFIREFQSAPPILAEKGKVLQILSNLIRNAKRASTEAAQADKREKSITLRIEVSSAGMVRLSVRDHGVGISLENLTRIFAPNFTRSSGHRFDLHACANAAREMKGSLIAMSDGIGKGATFVFELPAAPAAKTNVAPSLPSRLSVPDAKTASGSSVSAVSPAS